MQNSVTQATCHLGCVHLHGRRSPPANDIPDWPEADLMELLKHIRKDIPQKDNLRFDLRADKLNWDNISFGVYSAEQCKQMWAMIQKRQRIFRLLEEVVEDAMAGVSKPWTNQKQLFYADKENGHKNDPDFDQTEFTERSKEQWRNMSDREKVVWIDCALEEEAKYHEELKSDMLENPNFVPRNVKTVLTKEEKYLKDRVAGKPEKPPNSGYSLFSRIMLVSPEIKEVPSKERRSHISKLWKSMTESHKKTYQEEVNQMQDEYKLAYATYLESLPEDKRQEELQNNQRKRKPATLRPASSKTATKRSKINNPILKNVEGGSSDDDDDDDEEDSSADSEDGPSEKQQESVL